MQQSIGHLGLGADLVRLRLVVVVFLLWINPGVVFVVEFGVVVVYHVHV